MNTILCPVDYSEHSRAALERASHLAERTGGRLVVMHVEPILMPAMAPMPPAGMGMALDPATITPVGEVISDNPQQDAADRAKSEDALRSFTSPCDLDCERIVLHGRPADCILKAADERSADQIVMGTHGHTGVLRVLLGSTAEEVVRKAKCPVTVVKGSGADTPDGEE